MKKPIIVTVVMFSLALLALGIKLFTDVSLSSTEYEYKESYKLVPSWMLNPPSENKIFENGSKYLQYSKYSIKGSNEIEEVPTLNRIIKAGSNDKFKLKNESLYLNNKEISKLEYAYNISFGNNEKNGNLNLSKINIENSGYFTSESSAKIRAILKETYPSKNIIDIKDKILNYCKGRLESCRVCDDSSDAKTCTVYNNDFVDYNTVITATELALYSYAGDEYCLKDEFSSICKWQSENSEELFKFEIKNANNTEMATIKAINNYLRSLEYEHEETDNLVKVERVYSEKQHNKFIVKVIFSNEDKVDLENIKFYIGDKEVKIINHNSKDDEITYLLEVEGLDNNKLDIEINSIVRENIGPFIYKNKDNKKVMVGMGEKSPTKRKDIVTVTIPKIGKSYLSIYNYEKGTSELVSDTSLKIVGPGGYGNKNVVTTLDPLLYSVKESGIYKVEKETDVRKDKIYKRMQPVHTRINADSKRQYGINYITNLYQEFTKVTVSNYDMNDDKRGLANSELVIYDKNDKLFIKWISDGTDKVIEKMPIGEYYLKQLKAPEGYKVNDDVIKFKVKENRDSTLVVKNKKIGKVKFQPQNLYYISSLMIMFFVVSIFVLYFILKVHKRRKK